MKIAVSSNNETNVTGHAGHCLQFLIYEVNGAIGDTKQILRLTQDQSFHATSGTVPQGLSDVNVLISGSMGGGLARRLESNGIQPVVTPETDPDAAVAAFLSGSLVVGAPEEHGHTHNDADHESGNCRCNG